jgi:hypothetical protein
MLKSIKALENYIVEKQKEYNPNPIIIKADDYAFIITKINAIKDEFNKLDLKVKTAEQKEKLGIKRQETFGKSQTKVEESRHKNIMEEISKLKEAGITSFNRSSYPFYPRHTFQKRSGKKHKFQKQSTK